MTVDIAINANRIYRLTAVNRGPVEVPDDPGTDLRRYAVTATSIAEDGTRSEPWAGEVLHHRSHGALALAGAIIGTLAAEVMS